MALGGGVFTTYNKVLPGTYINFISAKRAVSLLGERGVAALALSLDWGQEEEIRTITKQEFMTESLSILGYEYRHESLKGLRDLFIHADKLYLYRLNSGVKASNVLCTAKYSGVRGNDIKIVVQKNSTDESKFDVITVLGTKKVDTQTVVSIAELKSNFLVDFKAEGDLEITGGTPLAGGTSTEAVTIEAYETFLDKLEPYAFNALGCFSTDVKIKQLFVDYTRRMRDEAGAKFQTVLYQSDADYEGIISVGNAISDENWPQSSAIYWITGAQAGCNVSKSLTNKTYDGEFSIVSEYKQKNLEKALLGGKFILHQVGDEVRVLEDINTLVTITEDRNEDFRSNQTIRVLDQIAMDIAGLFNNKYLGKISNDDGGRVSLWNDIVNQHKQLERIQAIENFDAKDVMVEAGNNKKSVIVSDKVTPVNAMAQLYMNVVVE